MLNKFIKNHFFNLIMPIFLVFSLFSISFAQGNEANTNDPLSMLFFSLGLIGIGFFIRRYLSRKIE